MRFISAEGNNRHINLNEVHSFDLGTKEIVARMKHGGVAVIYRNEDRAKLNARWNALQTGIEMGHGLINIQ